MFHRKLEGDESRPGINYSINEGWHTLIDISLHIPLWFTKPKTYMSVDTRNIKFGRRKLNVAVYLRIRKWWNFSPPMFKSNTPKFYFSSHKWWSEFQPRLVASYERWLDLGYTKEMFRLGALL